MAIIRVETDIATAPTGLLQLGDEVTWRARHLGITQEWTSRITAFDRPRHFRDEMVRGVFRSAPFGPLGTLVERLNLTSYMARFLERRGRL